MVGGERFWENDLVHLDIGYSVEATEEEHRNSGIYKVGHLMVLNIRVLNA